MLHLFEIYEMHSFCEIRKQNNPIFFVGFSLIKKEYLNFRQLRHFTILGIHTNLKIYI